MPEREHILLNIVAAQDPDGDGLADLWIWDEVGGERRRLFLLHGGAQAWLEAVPELGAVAPLTAADLDGDGRAELVGYTGDNIVAWTRGGRGWTRLWSTSAPRCQYATAGDGLPEVVLGCGYTNKDQGEVRILSSGGGQLVRLVGARGQRRFGLAVVTPGDLDGDGRGELAVSFLGGAALFTNPLKDAAPSMTWSAE